MNRAELAGAVRTQVALVVGVDEEEIEEGTDLREKYDIDSLELMEIGTRLEKVLGYRFQVEDFMHVRSVGDTIDLLQEQA
ncbi:acyl carrier protein [Streptomyces sp. Amel2xB2]|nr:MULTISPECIES: acyl carrier protein [Streptomyces]RAJ67182.1 acyl carrier protein [Streptomyces sp. Amel2xB2]